MNKFSNNIFRQAAEKPALFYKSFTRDLWTDPHIAKMMLETHLDSTTDLASYKTEAIDKTVEWLKNNYLPGPEQNHIDLGCGPGLYTSRLAAMGVNTTGLDFSENSINYAREYAEKNNLDVKYILGSYLDTKFDKSFDLVTLISCDICALSGEQRNSLFAFVKSILKPGGTFLFDFQILSDFDRFQEVHTWYHSGSGGFFSAEEHTVLEAKFRYEKQKASCSKYTIISADGSTREMSIFHQYYSPEMMQSLLNKAGFKVKNIYENLYGEALKKDSYRAAIAAELA